MNSRPLKLSPHIFYVSIPVVFLILSLLLLSPWLMSCGFFTSGMLVRYAFSSICHQLPERCFTWLGYPFPICSRCLGILCGAIAGWLFLQLRRAIPLLPYRSWLCLSIFIMAIDIIDPYFPFYLQNSLTRFLSGAFFGLCFSPFLIFAAEELFLYWKCCQTGETSL